MPSHSNSEKGTKLATCAARCIENEMSITKVSEKKMPQLTEKGKRAG
jgi:DNA-directed RNA polymerase specialized sigma subunit